MRAVPFTQLNKTCPIRQQLVLCPPILAAVPFVTVPYFYFIPELASPELASPELASPELAELAVSPELAQGQGTMSRAPKIIRATPHRPQIAADSTASPELTNVENPTNSNPAPAPFLRDTPALLWSDPRSNTRSKFTQYSGGGAQGRLPAFRE